MKWIPQKLRMDVGLLVLRVSFGLMMMWGHGWGKLSGFSEKSGQFADPLGVGPTATLVVAVLTEFFAAGAIAAGFLTRLAAFGMGSTMAVAAFVVHASDPFGGKERALVYLAVSVVLVVTGAGKFSVDHWVGKKRSG